MPNRIRLIIGILIWAVLLGWAGNRLYQRFSDPGDSVANELLQFAVVPRSTCKLDLYEDYVLRIGDPIFWRNPDGQLVQIGMIRQVESAQSQNYAAVQTSWASAVFFSNAPPLNRDDYLLLHETPDTMAWVAESLLPEHKRVEIARYIGQIVTENSDVIVEQLKPVFLEALSATGLVVRDELAESLARHQQEWQQLGDRLQRDIVEQELVPLINSEVWPVVQEEMAPVLEKIGEKIWRQASVWRFGWRAVYDSLPLPQQDLTQQEFSRFVEESALPVLSSSIPELMAAQQRILNRVVKNPGVQQFVTDTFIKISGDPQLQSLMVTIVEEAVLNNPDFQEQLDQIWNQPEVREALRFSDARFGPYVETIGEKLFGSPTRGVTPEFARILRHRIFLKDPRWLVLTNLQSRPSPVVSGMDVRQPGVLPVILAPAPAENPFFIEARDRN